MSKKYRDRHTEKITHTYKLKGQTDGEDNAYVRTYECIRVLRPKSHILKVLFPIAVSVSVSFSVSGSVSGSVSVVRGNAPYI